MRRVLFLLAVAAWSCGGPGPGTRALTILHMNDLHAHFLPDDQGMGGFARLAGLIARERARSEGALVLVGGDLVQGTPVSTIYEGLPCFDVANEMGIDAASLGNHEFDYGWPRILEFEKTARFPLVAANVADDQGKPLLQRDRVILQANGLRVAVIGLLTETLPQLTKEKQRGPWKVRPLVATLRGQARAARNEADLVVAVGHLTPEEEDSILAEAPEVSVLVSGHNHAGQTEVKEVDGRLGVKVKAYGVELGRLDLEVDPDAKRVVSHQWHRIRVDAGAPEDPKVAALVTRWERKVGELVDVPIGTAAHRIERPELLTLVEEAMKDAVGADIAYQNRGGIRDVLPQGTILVRHIWNVLPFDNALVYGTFRGRDLPREVRESRKVEPDREYIFVTNDFLADQWKGEGFRAPKEGPSIRDAMIDWVKERKRLP